MATGLTYRMACDRVMFVRMYGVCSCHVRTYVWRLRSSMACVRATYPSWRVYTRHVPAMACVHVSVSVVCTRHVSVMHVSVMSHVHVSESGMYASCIRVRVRAMYQSCVCHVSGV